MSYPETPLGAFLSVSIDAEPVDSERTYATAGIYSYGRGLFKKPLIQGSETSYAKYTKLHKGQFVYSKLFGWEGATATVGPDFDGLYVSHEFPTFTIDPDMADQRYVTHLARWSGLHAKLRDKGTGVGSRRQRVNVDRLLATTVPLPDLPEQRRIAGRLDAVSAKLAAIEAAQNSAADLRDTLANALLANVSGSAPLATCLREARDSVAVEPEHEYEITGIYSFGQGLIRRPPIRGSETSYGSFTKLQEGQLVMSKLNAWEGALTVVSPDFSGSCVSPEYPVFNIDNSKADPGYIAHLASWPGLWNRLTPRGSMVRRKRTTPATLLSTTVPMPDLPEQRRIARVLDQIEAARRFSDTQVSGAKDLQASLLNAAFSGNL